MKFKQLLKIAFSLVISILVVSCKKTETIEPPAQAQNRILSYQVTNVSGDPLVGVVNDTEKTIKLYLPYYLYLTVLQPAIKVSEGASINPASGVLVENLLDVFDQGKTVEYTVTGKDGSKATYKLIIEVQQGDFKLEEISASATDLTELTFDHKFKNDYLTVNWSGDIPSGNAELDRQLLKITLTDQNQKTYVIDNNRGAKLSATALRLDYLLSYTSVPGLESGIYTVKVRFYGKTASLKYPVKITVLP
ncbi:hypothetical protein [Pedobacter sp.]|jgi:hypothetical protein|uniref:hypothetical protein n=1 Tax=Pedobacter sp. TaxID=1411316 RepID=UPI002BB3DBA1|nr:hypothetical protein [Pedobacter sp.]HWW41698.1 hypothetical protein [Pedobacter sp.]